MYNNKPFTFHFLRPFFDLNKADIPGPMMNNGPLIAFNSYETILNWGDILGTQRILSGAFRRNLIYETKLNQYSVDNPLSLDKQLWTNEWEKMCEMTLKYSDLSDRQKVWLIRVWLYLGFYNLILEKVKTPSSLNMSKSEEKTTIGYLRAFSFYMLRQGNWNEYSPKDMENVLKHGNRNSRGHYEAAKTLLIYHSKVTKNVSKVKELHGVMSRYLELPKHNRNSFWYKLVSSAHYRGTSYLAQLENRKEDVVKDMDIAEEYGREVINLASSETESIVSTDNLHPLLESRMREALWLNDIDLAYSRMQEVISIDPWDSKARIELGEILWKLGRFEDAAKEFKKGAIFGPPGTTVCHFMAGQSFEQIGDFSNACQHYLAALNLDPNGINSAVSLLNITDSTKQKPIYIWVREKLLNLKKMNVLSEEDLKIIEKDGVRV